MNTWPDGGMTPFRNEKNSNWEGAFRVPAMVRWPGKIKPGPVSNEIVSHLDWMPTLLAAAGDPDIKEKLKKGHRAGNKTFKVHLDGYNQLPYLTGQRPRAPAQEFFYFTDDGDLVAAALRQLEARVHGAARHGHAQSGPSRSRRSGCRRSSTCGPTPTSAPTSPRTRTTTSSSTALSCSCRRRQSSAQFLETFKEFPPRQKAASFSVDQVMESLRRSLGSK